MTIIPETAPIDYLVALYGHPSTWLVDGGKVTGATVKERCVAITAIMEPRGEGVVVVRNASGAPIWEALISEVRKQKECKIWLREK